MWRRKPPLTRAEYEELRAGLKAALRRLEAVERTAHWHCSRCRRSTESSALFSCQPGDQVCRPIKPAEAA